MVALKPITVDNSDQIAEIAQIEKPTAKLMWLSDGSKLIVDSYDEICSYDIGTLQLKQKKLWTRLKRKSKPEPYAFAPPHQIQWPDKKEVSHFACNTDMQITAVCYQTDKHHIHIYDSRTRTKLTVLEQETNFGQFAMNPDGSSLIVKESQKGYLWNLKTGERPIELPYFGKVAFTSDGRKLAAVANGKLYVLNPHTGAMRFVLNYKRLRVMGLAFSPDGHTVAACGISSPIMYPPKGDAPVRLWDTETGNETKLSGKCDFEAWSLAFSPDGSLLVAGKGDAWSHYNPIQTWDAKRATPLKSIRDYKDNYPGPTNPVTQLSFDPQGRILASQSKVIQLWGIVDAPST